MPATAPPKVLWLATAVIVLAGGAAWGVWFVLSRDVYKPPPLSFAGDADKLQHTIIVPTLDTPTPEHKSVIWCSAFQLAWNELKSQLAKGPVELKDAQASAERLNQAPQTLKDLEANDVYAVAGLARDRILDTIRRSMAARFGKASVPELPALPDTVAVAFAHLRAEVEFTHPYFDLPHGWEFTDSAGHKTPMRAFGIAATHHDIGMGTFRDQIAVLYDRTGEAPNPERVFILDLDKHSKPYQLVLAHISWQGTLQKTLDDVTGKISKKGSGIGKADQLAVPVMRWQLSHHFRELENKEFLNPPLHGLLLAQAMQSIHFQMDRNGVQIASTAYANVKSAGSNAGNDYFFDQPFLLYLKKREADRPFFVMWVDNAELLSKK